MIRQLQSLPFLRFNRLKIFVLLFPFIVIVGSYLAYQQDPFLLVHPNKEDLHTLSTLTTFDDRGQKGKSKVEILKNQSNILSYRYTISNAFLNPYAGVEYVPGEGKFF